MNHPLRIHTWLIFSSTVSTRGSITPRLIPLNTPAGTDSSLTNRQTSDGDISSTATLQCNGNVVSICIYVHEKSRLKLTPAPIGHSAHCLKFGRTSFGYGRIGTPRSTAMTYDPKTKLATNSSVRKWSYFTPSKTKSWQSTPTRSSKIPPPLRPFCLI